MERLPIELEQKILRKVLREKGDPCQRMVLTSAGRKQNNLDIATEVVNGIIFAMDPEEQSLFARNPDSRGLLFANLLYNHMPEIATNRKLIELVASVYSKPELCGLRKKVRDGEIVVEPFD